MFSLAAAKLRMIFREPSLLPSSMKMYSNVSSALAAMPLRRSNQVSIQPASSRTGITTDINAIKKKVMRGLSEPSALA